MLYQWNKQQEHALAVLIAGKSKAQTTVLLEQQLGISTIAIQLSGRDTGTLPTDPDHIQILFVAYGQ